MERKRILIVDDAFFQLEVLKELLENKADTNLEVEIASDFQGVSKVLLKEDCDYIIVDYLLGSIGTGVELKARVQNNLDTNAKWVMMSTLNAEALAEQHHTDGFSGFIQKADCQKIAQDLKALIFA